MKIEIDIKALSWGALMDLETASKTSDIAKWLVEHAGQDMDALRQLSVAEISEVSEQIGTAVQAAISVPKTKGRRS